MFGPAQAGQTIRIGWEELARSRPPRFTDGGLVLVALGPLPASSLWRQRFPSGGALAVAADGHAFLRDPDPATVTLLEKWAKTSPREREEAAGVALLAALWATAAPSVSEGALERLAQTPGLEGKLQGEGGASLAAGLADGARPLPLRAAMAQLVSERRLLSLAPSREARAAPGGPLEAPALDALGALSDGLPPDRVRGLLARAEPALRAVGARQARGKLLEPVQKLVKADPAPEVRAAAVVALLDQKGMAAFDVAAGGLLDSDPTVRAAAAKRIGALGAPAVPPLVILTNARNMPEAAAFVGALALTGAEGRAAVKTIAETHRDPKVRDVAKVALGQLGEEH